MRRIRFFLLFFAALISFNTFCNAQTITYISLIKTLAGDSTSGNTGNGGPATLAELNAPSGVAADRHGNVFIADQLGNVIRVVNAAGIISIVAGDDTLGYTGDNGPATAARLSNPTGVAVDRYGSLYIADQYNNVVRKVDTNGIITTFAGNASGTAGFSGDGGPAISDSAKLWHPADVGVDTQGNVYIIDQDNNRVRKVDTNGILTTLAGTGTPGYNGDGILAVNAQLNFPAGGGQVDKFGNVYIADFYNSRIRKVSPEGIIYTVAGNGTGGFGGDNGPAVNAEIYDASAVGLDDSGNIYVDDYYNDRIRKVDHVTGIITTIAGTGVQSYGGDNGPAVFAALFWPQGCAVDSAGNVFIADFGNHRVREITLVADTSLSTDTSNAIKNISSATGVLSVFPNPSMGQFTVKVTSDKLPCNISVCNAIGGVVYQSVLNSLQATIDLKSMPAGVYFLYCTSAGQETSIHKLILNNN